MWIGLKIIQNSIDFSAPSLGYDVGNGMVYDGSNRYICTNQSDPDSVTWVLKWFDTAKPTSFSIETTLTENSKPLPTDVVCVAIHAPFSATDDEILAATENVYVVSTEQYGPDAGGYVELVFTLLDEIITSPIVELLTPNTAFDAVVTMCDGKLITINTDADAIEFVGKTVESFAASVIVDENGNVASITKKSHQDANLLNIKMLTAVQTDADKAAVSSIKKQQKAGTVITTDDKLLLILKSKIMVDHIKDVVLSGDPRDCYRMSRLAGLSASDSVLICEAIGRVAQTDDYLREEAVQLACSSIKNAYKLDAFLKTKNRELPKISITSEWADAIRGNDSIMQVIVGAGLKKVVA